MSFIGENLELEEQAILWAKWQWGKDKLVIRFCMYLKLNHISNLVSKLVISNISLLSPLSTKSPLRYKLINRSFPASYLLYSQRSHPALFCRNCPFCFWNQFIVRRPLWRRQYKWSHDTKVEEELNLHKLLLMWWLYTALIYEY